MIQTIRIDNHINVEYNKNVYTCPYDNKKADFYNHFHAALSASNHFPVKFKKLSKDSYIFHIDINAAK